VKTGGDDGFPFGNFGAERKQTPSESGATDSATYDVNFGLQIEPDLIDAGREQMRRERRRANLLATNS
jgi:hypothetical protein